MGMRTSLILAVAALTIAGCTSTRPQATTVVSGHVTAGPVCPVQTDPPDPACAARDVAGARVVATADGSRVEAVTGVEGRFALDLAPGDWIVSFEPVEGLLGVPDSVDITVKRSSPSDLGEITYDTGIR
jgi:hypothetical protein